MVSVVLIVGVIVERRRARRFALAALRGGDMWSREGADRGLLRYHVGWLGGA